ncbi:hypothetical protein [Streptosporangium sp. NPDC049078]|uniref:hypothetical protein n=1 Tax=Streptosporangium sp. NPDC049078 TaxID=3155767 RepID=UPI0034305FD3
MGPLLLLGVTMTSFGYTGPATLIIGGNELHITVRIGVESEAVNGFVTRRWWADLTFHPFTPPNEDAPCRLRLPDGREGSGHLPAGATRMVGVSFPPNALPLPDRADDIEVHAVDERGRHITRIIPGQPPATDHTLIPTAELEQLRLDGRNAETLRKDNTQLREEVTQLRINAEKDVCSGCMQREEQRDRWMETCRQLGVKLGEVRTSCDEMNERAQAAEAEVARLRAGESPNPAPEGVQLTPAQWIHRWNQATADERLAKVEQIFNDGAAVIRCQQQDHGAALHELADAQQIINRIRQLADVYNHGANTSPDPATRAWAASIVEDLRAALNGTEAQP